MYALLDANEDFALSTLNLKFVDMGLRFKGIKKIIKFPIKDIKCSDYHINSKRDFRFVYEITNEKRFKFFCIRIGMIPEIVESNPI